MTYILPTVVLFGLFFLFLIYLPLRHMRKKARALTVKANSELNELRSKILAVSSNTIPAKKLSRYLAA